MPVERGLIGAVIAGKQHHAAARSDTVTVDVGGHRRRLHNAGNIVVSKHQRSFKGTGGQHHALGAHPVQALATSGGSAQRQVVAATLQNTDKIMVVIAKGGASRQPLQVSKGFQFGDHKVDPGARRPILDGLRRRQQTTTKLALFVDNHHPRTGAGSLARRH